jgi:4-oxalocrotonate tautomerase
MPYIELKIARERLSRREAQRLSTGITDIMSTILNKKRSLVAVSIEMITPDQWFIADRRVADAAMSSAFVSFRITEGTNSDDEKSQAITAIYQLLEDVLGTMAEASYIVLDSVPATDRGYGGQTQYSRITAIKRLENSAIDVQHYLQHSRRIRRVSQFITFRELFRDLREFVSR